jgi:hypothetical protein
MSDGWVGDRSAMPPRANAAVGASVTRPLDDFAALWRRRLASPLYEPPPVKPVETIRQVPTAKKKNKQERLALRLIGTVLESGQSQAIVADSRGNIVLRGVGETLKMATGSGRVERIELNQVTLSLGDDTLILKMQ